MKVYGVLKMGHTTAIPQPSTQQLPKLSQSPTSSSSSTSAAAASLSSTAFHPALTYTSSPSTTMATTNIIDADKLTDTQQLHSFSMRCKARNANSDIRRLDMRECAGCCKTITERYLLKALDLYWHEDCLKCGCCDCRLGEVGSTLYTKANLILCKRDYLRLFGTTGYCAACNKVIPAFEMVMRAKSNVYHLECFACQQCNHRFCVGDRFYLCENKILCQYDYEERLVFANMVQNPSSLAHIRRQVSNLQPAGESIVINNSNDSNENNNSCNRYNVMRNDSRSILPCLNDSSALGCQQQQQQQQQQQPPSQQHTQQQQQIKRDSGYGSSPDSETVELQALA